MSDLLPCPFCGATPELDPAPLMAQVFCPACNCATEPTGEAEDAVRAWNRRSHGVPAQPVAPAPQEAPTDAEMLEFICRQFSPLGLHINGDHAWQWRGNPDRLKGANMREAIRAAITKTRGG